MKKKSTLWLSILMMIVMCVTMAGCGSKKQSKKDDLVGTWGCTLNLASVVEDAMAGENASEEDVAELTKYFDFSKLELELNLTFTEDHKSTMQITAESFEQFVEEVKVVLGNGMLKMMEELYGMSAEDILKQAGMTQEQFLDSMMESSGFDDDSMKEIIEELESEETTYEVKDGVITFGNGETMTYELTDGTLKITDMTTTSDVDDEDFEMFKKFLPMTFTRK